jgi:hypothetical protein
MKQRYIPEAELFITTAVRISNSTSEISTTGCVWLMTDHIYYTVSPSLPSTMQLLPLARNLLPLFSFCEQSSGQAFKRGLYIAFSTPNSLRISACEPDILSSLVFSSVHPCKFQETLGRIYFPLHFFFQIITSSHPFCRHVGVGD